MLGRMRIIAGSAGGVPLFSPKTDARPTTDRVRQAVFSKIDRRLAGARVLDLFAGSGAMGLECLSRGSASAVFVDKARPCADLIRRNAEKTKLAEKATIHASDVFGWLRTAPTGAFDLVFADPPYRRALDDPDLAGDLLRSPDIPRLLAPGGLLVLESISRDALLIPAPWVLDDQRSYGVTQMSFLRPAPSSP